MNWSKIVRYLAELLMKITYSIKKKLRKDYPAQERPIFGYNRKKTFPMKARHLNNEKNK